MNRVYAAVYAIAWPFFCLTHPCRLVGEENIPEGGLLICSNHSGLSDPVYIVYALGRKRLPRIMAKAELRRFPLVGFILDKMGLIWVKRGKNDIGAIKSALKALKNQEQLLIFPEGTRHDEVGEGKTGAAMMAIRAGVPILPVFVPKRKTWFRRIPIVVGQAYQPFTEDRKPTNEDYRLVTEDLMQRIAKLEDLAK